MIARSFILIALLLGSVVARAETAQTQAPAIDGPLGYTGSILAPAPPSLRFTGLAPRSTSLTQLWAFGLLPAADLEPTAGHPLSAFRPGPRPADEAVDSATPYASGGVGCGDGTAATAGENDERVAYKVGAGLLLPAPARGNLDIGYRFCGTTNLRDIDLPGTAAEDESHRLHIRYRMWF